MVNVINLSVCMCACVRVCVREIMRSNSGDNLFLSRIMNGGPRKQQYLALSAKIY